MKKGFTLIELLVVIAIISLLTLFGVLMIRRQISKAHDAQRRDDLHRLTVAFEEYYSDANCYPPADILQNCSAAELSPYLATIPCDPVYRTPYCYVVDTTHPGCFKSFKILAHFDNDADPDIADLGYDSQCQADTGLTYSFNFGLASGNVTVANPNPSEPLSSPSPSAAGSSPSPNPSASASPLPSSNPNNIYYCQGFNNCTQFNTSQFFCSPNYSDPNCTGSNNCTTLIGRCYPKEIAL